ncbi:MAG TPA: helix-turn-helix domain-containing protein [Pseudonocardiaceae bacterium]|nr:helix-turn-helix domain-containing protein [Pseudonocardiaceae bacterium]
MSDPVKRPYQSQRRADAAKQTRRLIRDAAAELFVRQGISATTMRQVAVAAGVAERTVYTAFPNKTALFNEVIDIATVGDELPVPVAQRPEFTAALTESEPMRAARQVVAYGSELMERAGALVMAAIESSGADPDMREFCERGAAATSANLLTVTTAWHESGLLRDGMDPERARAILFALASPHVHHLLRHDQGWDAGGYRDWLMATIMRTLLRDG